MGYDFSIQKILKSKSFQFNLLAWVLLSFSICRLVGIYFNYGIFPYLIAHQIITLLYTLFYIIHFRNKATYVILLLLILILNGGELLLDYLYKEIVLIRPVESFNKLMILNTTLSLMFMTIIYFIFKFFNKLKAV